jgi:ParB family transcriptional regulator, chromosome partitioning protein
MRTPGLGKGLSALIPPKPSGVPASMTAGAEPQPPHGHHVLQIPLTQIERNPEQPRHEFSESDLQDLAQSIRAHGILQPLIVTRSGDRYVLVAGERRLKAARRAGLTEVPCIVHESLTQRGQLELALIENVQRADLNPLEQARAFKRLNEEFGLTHEDIARAVGKERPTVTNTLRLLELPDEMQAAMREGRMTFGQARGLLAVKDSGAQRAMFEKILRGELSARALERKTRTVHVAPHTRRLQNDPQLAAYEQDLSRALGTRVRIKKIGDGGSVEIEYYSDEELSGIVERLTPR